MYCPNCRSYNADGVGFCATCGMQFNSAPPAPPAPPAPNYSAPNYAPPAPNYSAPNYGGGGGSTWDGGVLETFIAGIVASLIMTLTCGIATPWAVCYMWRFIMEHSVIDGRRMTFDGNGAELLGQWIVWMLLTAITCGIYSFWVIPKMYKWIASHTHFV